MIRKYIADYPKISIAELAVKMNVSSRTIQSYLKELRNNGEIKRVGSKQAGYYIIVENELLNQKNEPLNKIQKSILHEIELNNKITKDELVTKTGKSRATITRNIMILRKMNQLDRNGSDKTGIWVIK